MNTGESAWIDRVQAYGNSWLNGMLLGLIVVAFGLGTFLKFGERSAAIFLGVAAIGGIAGLYFLGLSEKAFRYHCRQVGIKSPVWRKGFWLAVAALVTLVVASSASLVLGFYMVSKLRLPW